MVRVTIPWPDGPAIQQAFSLPMPIIRYIAENPSSFKVFENLIQSCKYFFEMKALLVAHRMRGTVRDGYEICSYDKDKCFLAGYGCSKKCCFRIELDQIPARKIWLVNELYLVEEYIPQFATDIRPKFYRCDTVKFRSSYNIIAFDDLKILAATFKKFDLEFMGVYRPTEDVALENLLEALPDVEEFSFNFRKSPSFAFTVKLTPQTFANIRKLDNLGNLKLLELEGLPAIVDKDLDELALFIQERKDTKFFINFYFPDGISYGTKTKLDAFIDDIKESNVPFRLITYRGQDKQKLDAMKNLCDKFFDMKFY